MLWQKESSDADSMYIDLLKSTSIRKKANKKLKNQANDTAASVDFPKNDQIANRFRQVGNDKFKQHKFLDAMMLYNRSLCFAENGSEALSLA